MSPAETVFWISFFTVVYSYALYPLLLKFLSLFKKGALICFDKNEVLPSVTILMAAYNEEKVITQKIESILRNHYPADKIEIIIGSDNSSDRTNELIGKYAAADSRLSLIIFPVRIGKINIINELVKKASHELLILTDANVMFDENTIYELVKHFKNPQTGLVDSRMINTGIKKDGISLQEKSYIQTEVYLKHYEGLLWGTMMGPFGGCYSLRKKYYKTVPSHFLVDDFYINMQVLLAGSKCINEMNAKAYEDVSNDAGIEFRRKVRIAAGSFQNLFYYFPSLFLFNAVSFCFFSHKVLRWMGPLFILALYCCSIILCRNPFYSVILALMTLAFLTPLFDFVLVRWMGFHNALIRFMAHFITTNAAQVAGFARYISGIKSSIWQPTDRHQ